MKFKYLDHTSEAKFQAFGDNLAECFGNAILATIGLMTKLEEVEPIIKKEIRIESKTKESLLYDLIDEVIYLVDVDLMFISKVENYKLENNVFTCTVYGDEIKNCPRAGDVKAPTYDEMLITDTMVQVVVDV